MSASDMSSGPVTEPKTMRRNFILPAEDIEALTVLGKPWETVIETGVQWLLIHDWELPHGLTSTTVTIAIRIVPGYPSAALDMVYVHPRLGRKDGRRIGGLSDTIIDGVTYQQWSRHYSAQNPWRPNTDSIASHLRVVESWFSKAAE